MTAFALVTILNGTAAATMLTATDGGLTFFLLDRAANFSGDGFSVQMTSPFGLDTTAAFTSGMVSIFTVFDNSGFVSVDISGKSCTASSLTCGTITLTSAGLPPAPADWPSDVDYVATTPFTATGHLDVAAGFDFVGQGLLTGTICRHLQPSLACAEGPELQYVFGVPDSPGLLTLVGGALAIAGLFILRWSRRATRRGHA